MTSAGPRGPVIATVGGIGAIETVETAEGRPPAEIAQRGVTVGERTEGTNATRDQHQSKERDIDRTRASVPDRTDGEPLEGARSRRLP